MMRGVGAGGAVGATDVWQAPTARTVAATATTSGRRVRMFPSCVPSPGPASTGAGALKGALAVERVSDERSITLHPRRDSLSVTEITTLSPRPGWSVAIRWRAC